VRLEAAPPLNASVEHARQRLKHLFGATAPKPAGRSCWICRSAWALERRRCAISSRQSSFGRGSVLACIKGAGLESAFSLSSTRGSGASSQDHQPLLQAGPRFSASANTHAAAGATKPAMPGRDPRE